MSLVRAVRNDPAVDRALRRIRDTWARAAWSTDAHEERTVRRHERAAIDAILSAGSHFERVGHE